MNKKAQFFILAAVIISAVIASLALTHNYAQVNKEPKRFYDLSYELKQESAKVIDYGIATNVADLNANMSDFTSQAAHSLRDKYPDVGFVFIYGNLSHLIIENYGSSKSVFQIGDQSGTILGGGSETKSNIILTLGDMNFSETSAQSNDIFSYNWRANITNLDTLSSKTIFVKVNEQDYSFVIKPNEQFFMVLMKSEGKEDFVSMK